MSKKIINMSDYCADATRWSPADMLRDAKTLSTSNFAHIKKAIIIFYDEENIDIRSRIRWSQSGMTRLEIVNLLSLAHDDLIMDMLEELAEG
jgi:hypothetical protein